MEKVKWISYLTKTENRFILLMLAVFFTLPFGTQAITNSLLLAFLIHSIFSIPQLNWKQAFNSPLFIFSGLFFALHLVSLIWTTDFEDGLFQLETKLTFFFGPLLIIAGIGQKVMARKNLFLKSFVFGNLAVSIAALAFAAYQSYVHGAFYEVVGDAGEFKRYFFTYETLSKPFMHPGYLSTYLGLASLISIYFLVKAKGKERIAYAVLLFFFFVMIVMLQGRINILALIAVLGVGALVAAVKQKAYKWLLVPVIPVLLLVGFMIFGSESVKARYFQAPDFSYDISGDEFNSATYRLAEWTCALDVIKQQPILGTGIGGNREALFEAYKKRGFWNGLERHFNCHNQYLETTLALGLLGLLLLLALFFTYGRIAFQKKDWLSLSALLFFALSMLTESMFERAWAVLLFTLYFPLMLFSATKSSE